MLQQVDLGHKSIEIYEPVIGTEKIDELRSIASKLKKLRLLYINSTPFGGGVAELLSAYLPLLRNLGIQADWRIIYGNSHFFSITKMFHNGLQGAKIILSEDIKERYLGNIMENAKQLDLGEYDVVVINDPQPAALIAFSNMKAKWIWRAHIDMASPDLQIWQFLKPFIEQYSAAIFTMKEFIPKDLTTRTEIIPPAIDISNTKNMDLPPHLPRAIMLNSGVKVGHPVLLQVSRFDVFKDPYGVIETYRLVKKHLPKVQLVLVGTMAHDDPEAWQMYGQINQEAVSDPDMYVYTNQTSTGSLEVNAFQRGSDVVIQKSLKEGFGLVVSESLWKAKPVVAGRAGGIKLQMKEKLEDLLIDSTEEAAEKVVYLLKNPQMMHEYGDLGKKRVEQYFLMPRFIKEELQLISEIAGV